MPLLQVRDFPKDVYEEIGFEARRQHRTIAQETIVLIKKGLGEESSRKERRKMITERIRAMDVPEEWKNLDAAALIREMREERINQIMNAIGGADDRRS